MAARRGSSKPSTPPLRSSSSSPPASSSATPPPPSTSTASSSTTSPASPSGPAAPPSTTTPASHPSSPPPTSPAPSSSYAPAPSTSPSSKYPVYFAFEDEKINAILDEVKTSDASGQPATATTTGVYKFIVPTPEPKKISSPTLTNIQGWLPGLRVDGDASQLPTIAIVASYDTFGAAPALVEGSDSNGSGVVVLLEIARLFSRLYSDPKTRGSYNLLFGLTSGGPYNYNGTLKWLRSFDQRLRESVDYAICLNSVGSWDD